MDSRSDSLPEEDQETQRALMERVLEILLEVETLTLSERSRVQDGLTSIRSGIAGASTQGKQIGYGCCLFSMTSKSHYS